MSIVLPVDEVGIKSERHGIKMSKKICVLEQKSCVDCGECNICDVDKTKICDNCEKCLPEITADKFEIIIDEIIGG